MKLPLYALLISPDPQMWADILSEKKKITIREGHRDYQPGPAILCCHLTSRAVMVDITNVRYCTLKEVTEEEYRADGFNSREELLAGLQNFYPDMTFNTPVTVIRWQNVRGRLVDQYLPYLPRNRKILYVSPDNKYIKEAAKMLADSGCVKQPTAAIIVKNGRIIGRGVNAGKRVKVCPRVIKGYPTGQGYELCRTECQQEGHCEVMAIRDALNRGNDPKGASMYLDGHWWICQPCWDEIIKVGISRVFLQKDSKKLFKV